MVRCPLQCCLTVLLHFHILIFVPIGAIIIPDQARERKGKRTMKYNKSEIMKAAWNLVKNYGIDRSTAMKAAWAQAKAEIEAAVWARKNDIVRDFKVVSNVWANNGKCRTYISVRYYSLRGVAKNKCERGYIDNMTGEYIAA